MILRSPLIRLLVSLIAVGLVVFCVALAVNPYGIWPAVFRTELFPLKTTRVNSVRLVKAYDLFKRCPDHVITGMSSVVWGIDPSEYPVAGKTLYNGGIVGSGMLSQYYYLMRYLHQCPDISRVYLDVNAESVTNQRTEPSDFIMQRLQREVIDPVDYTLFAGFTRSGLLAAYNTASQAESGIVNEMVYDRGDGYHRRPAASDDVYYQNFMAYLSAGIRSKVHIAPVHLAYFRAMVMELRRRKIELTVYFAPIHPFLQYANRFDGPHEGPTRADMYDQLKREVAKLTDFYDFSSYNALIGEDIAHIKYFIDDIHYRSNLGLLVLKALNGQRDANLPESFGVKVTAENVEDFIAAERRGIDQWAEDYPQYSKAIRDHFAHAPLLGLEPDW